MWFTDLAKERPTEVKVASMGATWACMSLHYVLCVYSMAPHLVVSVGILTVGARYLPALGILFLLLSCLCYCDSFAFIELPCPVSIWRILSWLILSCFLLFGYCLLEASIFLKTKQKASESGDESKMNICK